jgi:hypothetical protein
MDTNVQRIPLAEAIAALRKEIRIAAEAKPVDPEERFRITEAELELTIVAEDSTTVGAEVGWWVLKAKAGVSVKDASTHKIRLKLNLGDVEVGSSRTTL